MRFCNVTTSELKAENVKDFFLMILLPHVSDIISHSNDGLIQDII